MSLRTSAHVPDSVAFYVIHPNDALRFGVSPGAPTHQLPVRSWLESLLDEVRLTS